MKCVLVRAGLASAAILFSCIAPLRASATGDSSTILDAAPASHPPVFDGTLSDPEWKTAPPAHDFYNETTHRLASPDTATAAYVLNDANYLYVGFACTQSAPITETQATNNVGEETDDQVEVNIDTSGNGSRVYSFKSTPRGVRYQESSESARFNPPWRAAAHAGRGGWTAELAIPLRELRSSAGAWRINFQRRIAATNEDFSWAYDPHMVGADDARFWPRLSGVNVADSASRPLPYAAVYALGSFGADRGQFQQSSGAFGPQRARTFGADVTYPFTSTLAFVGTANPDFSNVELDQQTIAPQQFQRNLREYRPFFAEGARYLIPGAYTNVTGEKDEVFYSPSIGTFNSGEKIEGTWGLNSLGVLGVDGPGFADEAFGFEHTTPAQDFSYLIDGVLAHHSQDGSSVTPCPATLLRCTDETYQIGLTKQLPNGGWATSLVYSDESGDYVPSTPLAHAFHGSVFHERPFASYYLSYDDIGPYYAPVDGFTLLNDIRGPAIYDEFHGSGGDNSAVKDWMISSGGNRDVDRSGRVSFAQVFGDVTVDFRDRLTIEAEPGVSEQETSSGYPYYAGSQTLPYNQTGLKLSYAAGTSSESAVAYWWGRFATQCPVPSSVTSPNALFCSAYPNLYAPFYLQQVSVASSKPLGDRFSVSAEVDGDEERPFLGPRDGQWLRRVSIGENVSRTATISLGLRSISGTGGFAEPGSNFSAAFHEQYLSGDELFVAFGSPASAVTLNRLIVKYVLHVGRGGAGT